MIVVINTKTHRPLIYNAITSLVRNGACTCGWRKGMWGCITFGEHIAKIVDDRLGTK